MKKVEKDELKGKILAYMAKMKGKKKLKEKDVYKAIEEETGESKDAIKSALREMIDVGMLMYSYGGGASSVEIPSAEYLKEKGVYDAVIAQLKKLGLESIIR